MLTRRRFLDGALGAGLAGAGLTPAASPWSAAQADPAELERNKAVVRRFKELQGTKDEVLIEREDEPPLLYLGFEGWAGEVEASMSRAERIVRENGGQELPRSKAQGFWDQRHVVAERFARVPSAVVVEIVDSIVVAARIGQMGRARAKESGNDDLCGTVAISVGVGGVGRSVLKH